MNKIIIIVLVVLVLALSIYLVISNNKKKKEISDKFYPNGKPRFNEQGLPIDLDGNLIPEEVVGSSTLENTEIELNETPVRASK